MGRGLAPPQIHQHNRLRRNQSAPIGNVALIGFDGLPEALKGQQPDRRHRAADRAVRAPRAVDIVVAFPRDGKKSACLSLISGLMAVVVRRTCQMIQTRSRFESS